MTRTWNLMIVARGLQKDRKHRDDMSSIISYNFQVSHFLCGFRYQFNPHPCCLIPHVHPNRWAVRRVWPWSPLGRLSCKASQDANERDAQRRFLARNPMLEAGFRNQYGSHSLWFFIFRGLFSHQHPRFLGVNRNCTPCGPWPIANSVGFPWDFRLGFPCRFSTVTEANSSHSCWQCGSGPEMSCLRHWKSLEYWLGFGNYPIFFGHISG